jgi:hypothetical protein
MNQKALLLFFFCFNTGWLLSQSGESLFNPHELHEMRFYFEHENFWDSLSHNFDEYIDDSGVDIPYIKATVKIDGSWLDTVGVRQKGLSSHHASSAKKKPFKIDLNEFTAGQSFDGIKKFNLHNGACDPGMMRDFLVYNVLRKAGVRAPRVSYCRLYLNDEYWGLYAVIEQVDKTFVEKNFADEGGTLIKNIGWSELHWDGADIGPYLEDFQLKTNEQEDDWSNFLHFMDVLNNTSDEDFPAAIQKVFDVDLFLHVMAVDIMTNNWDSYIDNRRNWYLYHEPAGGQFHWIPWDYNLSLGGTFSYGGEPFPPFDSTCYLQADFKKVHTGSSTFQFSDQSLPAAEYWLWDFGDGTVSSEKNPTHTFANQEEITVCLTAYRLEGGKLCQNTRCKKIDLEFDPTVCNSILNGSCPYPATDPVYQLVVAQDDYCCEDTWDAVCSLQYYELSQSGGNSPGMGVAYDTDFPILLNDPDKILIDRLLKVPEFRERYLDIACIMLENNFTEERLFPLIDSIAALIRPSIKEDPNYFFAPDYFEYDLGNGTGGGGGAKIPALKWVLGQRFEQMKNDLAQVGHDCGKAFSPVGWHSIVINEIVASSNEQSGLPDNAGEYEDWIEMYNNTPLEIDLKNFYLTDDGGAPLKWTFPFGSKIAPFGYLIVWADKDEDQPGVHANFKLSSAGESLLLRHEDGTIIDSLTFGPQLTNIAFARIPNGLGDFVQTAPTFNQKNEIVSGISEAGDDGGIRVYPNPAADFLIVDFSRQAIGSEEFFIKISNPLGQMVFVEKTGWDRQRIDLPALPGGWYSLEISPENKQPIRKKILINRNE